ncbi:phosphoribosylanthranilate isomerase [Aquibacillus salsiterrae]|uniref:N-(5'-phosphoribosyl)anthranilate isomerase n=1 Tax=Aquibacillus salsiterrae TaxID=2950439 RepID=A0A9X3WJC6_9BACI|nr:phosphoribosylanthranilate isomerase [Aquibacillus salsiterrae]MDC3418126.1 phosphoribosylanthranilate isomerase [Aquibacillus salsiterrae]
MKVKICGILTEEAARHAANEGADFIGFVFAESKRKISVEKAKALAGVIPDSVKKVGVFVNEDLATIKAIAREVGLDYIQLHGDETPDFCTEVGLPIIKAFQIRSKEDLDRLSDYQVDYFLLDSPAGKYRGGNGETFDWSLTKHLSDIDGKVILAGGLHAKNVQTAIAEVNPIGVDVSSGVETDGVKDLEKMTAFVTEAKKGDTNAKL